MTFYLIVFLFSIPSLLLIIDLIKFAVTGSHLFKNIMMRILEFASMIVLPITYFLLLDEKQMIVVVTVLHSHLNTD
jgi:hypothetical protein